MLMDGMDYLAVIVEMEKKEGQHEANPFARVTPVSKEHEVLSEEEKETLSEETPVETQAETETKDETPVETEVAPKTEEEKTSSSDEE